MERKLKLPIGIENFEKIRTEGFYYVDKSGLIMELLENWGEVGGRLPGSSGADRSPGVWGQAGGWRDWDCHKVWDCMLPEAVQGGERVMGGWSTGIPVWILDVPSLLKPIGQPESFWNLYLSADQRIQYAVLKETFRALFSLNLFSYNILRRFIYANVYSTNIFPNNPKDNQ